MWTFERSLSVAESESPDSKGSNPDPDSEAYQTLKKSTSNEKLTFEGSEAEVFRLWSKASSKDASFEDSKPKVIQSSRTKKVCQVIIKL